MGFFVFTSFLNFFFLTFIWPPVPPLVMVLLVLLVQNVSGSFVQFTDPFGSSQKHVEFAMHIPPPPRTQQGCV